MHRTAITLILMLTFLAVADFAVAQQRTAVQSVSSNAIPVISTKATDNSKSRSPQRLRHKSRAVTTPPAPLSARQYQGLTGRSMPEKPPVMDVKSPEQPRLEHLQLTVQHNYSGFGWLDLNEIRHIDGKDNYASFYTATDPIMAWTRAHLKVDAGERYLLDFSVSVSDETTFTIDSSGGSQKSTVNKGSHHILVYLDADKSKTTTVALTSHDAQYTFFALDVTRVE